MIPQSTADTDLETHVGGSTASNVDLATAISDKLFLVILVVNALGFMVLLMAFRSIVVSAQAVAAIAISVCAAFGVVTACFQWGWGVELVGLDTKSGKDPIASFVPLIMFAVLFGLSMDYQVFLMSQIEQARMKVKGDSQAIALGLATGARVISAAALIMICVFGSFILNGDPTVKQFGVGLAVGVALAAMSVLLLAPALLVLAGKHVWWVPKWADRYLPNLDIEGAHLDDDDSAQAAQELEDGLDEALVHDWRMSELRKQLPPLDREGLDDDPIAQLGDWYELAEREVPLAEAMTLATADADGAPNARMVLLKGFGPEGLRFFSNYESVKGAELAARPRAALILYWRELDRQVRARGPVHKLTAEQSDEYFASRPRDSQAAAAVSPQSRTIDREELR